MGTGPPVRVDFGAKRQKPEGDDTEKGQRRKPLTFCKLYIQYTE